MVERRELSASPENTPRPAGFALGLPRPNPFGAGTRVDFTVPVDGRVSIVVYDVTGARVRTLLDEAAKAGVHEIAWDGRNDAGAPSPAGIYYLRVNASRYQQTRSVILLR